jgi:hypothetical protein
MPLPTIGKNDHVKIFDPNTRKWIMVPKGETEHATHMAVTAKMMELEGKFKQRIGRKPTEKEETTGVVEAAMDSRTVEEKERDYEWTPKVRETMSPLEKRLALAEEALEQEQDEPGPNATYAEKYAYDLRRMVAREQQTTADEMAHAAHLKRHEKQIALLEELENRERLSPVSDEAIRAKIDQALRQVKTPGGDGVETKRLFNEIDTMRAARQNAIKEKLEAEAVELGRRMAQSQQEIERLDAGEDPTPTPPTEGETTDDATASQD